MRPHETPWSAGCRTPQTRGRRAGWAWKIDPANPAGMTKVDIIGDHYTYSDMTGGQLKSV